MEAILAFSRSRGTGILAPASNVLGLIAGIIVGSTASPYEGGSGGEAAGL